MRIREGITDKGDPQTIYCFIFLLLIVRWNFKKCEKKVLKGVNIIQCIKCCREEYHSILIKLQRGRQRFVGENRWIHYVSKSFIEGYSRSCGWMQERNFEHWMESRATSEIKFEENKEIIPRRCSRILEIFHANKLWTCVKCEKRGAGGKMMFWRGWTKLNQSLIILKYRCIIYNC